MSMEQIRKYRRWSWSFAFNLSQSLMQYGINAEPETIMRKAIADVGRVRQKVTPELIYRYLKSCSYDDISHKLFMAEMGASR